jgi:hypothetical protein
MKFHKKNVEKDLDGWIDLPVKVILHEDGFYEGVLVEEQRNGILIKCSGKRVYILYESVLSIEEE